MPAIGRLGEAHHGRTERVEEARPERNAARDINLLAGKSNAGNASIQWQGIFILLYTCHDKYSIGNPTLTILIWRSNTIMKKAIPP